MRIILWLLFSLFVCCRVGAQTPNGDTTTYRTDSVIVYATREAQTVSTTPAPITILGSADISSIGTTVSIEDALRKVPGLFVNNRYNFAQGERISIRGLGSRSQFGVRNVRLLLDGLPLTFADGQSQLNTVEIGSIGMIEVLRGPSASLYGNASGGVIYLHSRYEDSTSLQVTPKILAGSDGLQKRQMHIGGSSGGLHYVLTGSETLYEGFRDFSTAHWYNLTSLLRYDISDSSRISLLLHLHSTPYAFNPGGMSKEELEANRTATRLAVRKSGAGKDVQQGQAGVQYSTSFGRQHHVDVSVFGILRTLYNPIFGRLIDLNRGAGGMRSIYTLDVPASSSLLRISAGFDAEFQSDTRMEYVNLGISDDMANRPPDADVLTAVKKGDLLTNQRENIRTGGLFSRLSLLTEKWLFSLGGRFDSYTFRVDDHLTNAQSGSVSFSRFSPSAGIIHYVSPTLHLYGNISTAFQTPSANELGNTPSGGGFNTDLRPETLIGMETGIRLFFSRLSIEATGFTFTTHNQIIPYQVATNSDVTYYRNAGATRNAGAEVSLLFQPVDGLRVRMQYSYMHYVFTDYQRQDGNGTVQLKGKTVPGVPSHQAFIGIGYDHPNGLSAEVNAQWVGSYYANDDNGSPSGNSDVQDAFLNPSYVVFDTRVGYKIAWDSWALSLFGGINNLFGLTYNASIIPNAAGNRFFEPAPGRTVYAGVEIPIHFGRK